MIFKNRTAATALLLSILVASFALFILIKFIAIKKDYEEAYWLWAGISTKDAPKNATIFYIYRGLIVTKENKTIFQRHGLYPYPIKSKKLFLVYRLSGGFANPSHVITLFLSDVMKWQRHSIGISGIQLDFDSPTGKLLVYSNYLKKIRHELPKKYALSITGLGDWAIKNDQPAMQSIANVTNEIVFQLYQGRQPLTNFNSYINALKNYPYPFRIGVLSAYPVKNQVAFLTKNANFSGPIYFIQRKK